MSDAAGAKPGAIPAAVLEGFPALEAGFEEVQGESGLLHETRHLLAADGREFVLQRVSNVFAPEIHDNIEAVTRHLAHHGFETFTLLRSRDERAYLELESAGRWRLMTRLPGRSFHRVQSTRQVDSAGELVGRFHRALDDFDAPLAPMGIPFRQTALYLTQLDEAIDRERANAHHALAADFRDRIRAHFETLGPAPQTRPRVIHGDLKISNVLFSESGSAGALQARSLIDLDTLMRAPLYCEWGDAWRSWCNPKGEDEREATFDLAIFEASLRGFARGYALAIERGERDSLIHATERIALELATRYATDILEEDYFAWDAKRFSRAADHNLRRTEGQLSLFAASFEAANQRRRLLEEVFPDSDGSS